MKPLPSVITAVIFLILFNHRTSSQSPENIDTIDAFTSASKALKIHGGTIYPTYALVQWEEYYEDEPHVEVYQMQWGTESEAFTDTVVLKPYKRKTVTTTTISPLSDNTTYYIRFYRVYEEKAKITDFEFTTPELPSVVSQPTLAGNNKIGLSKHRSVVYTLNGRAFRHAQSDRQPITFLHHTASGIYLMCPFTIKESAARVRTVFSSR